MGALQTCAVDSGQQVLGPCCESKAGPPLDEVKLGSGAMMATDEHMMMSVSAYSPEPAKSGAATASSIAPVGFGSLKLFSGGTDEGPPAKPTDGDPAAGSGPSVTMEFDDQGVTKEVTFYRSAMPLGLAFDNHTTPLVVSRALPGSQAELQGVQAGWAFVTVAGVNVQEMTCEDVVGLIKWKCMDLEEQQLTPGEPPKLELTFQANDQRKVVVFTKGPMGLIFKESSENPFIITRILVGSEAEKLGIGNGWELKMIGNEQVEGKEFLHIMGLLRNRSALLPKC